ncbi:MAG: O-methyltransferase [Tissierellia bacterium]|nr:O-methyltransferase [Tissierellia bacterium]
MNNINKGYIDEYLSTMLPESNGYLKELELYAEANHIPIIGKDMAQLLRLLIKIHSPRNILEIGTAIGYSALIMAMAAGRDCNIITIERQQDMVLLARDNIARTEYANRIEVLNGVAEDILPDLDKGFDLIFLDAAKGQYLQFFNHCKHLLRDGGLLISDNVLFKGMVASDDLVVRRKRTIVKRMREYLSHISNLDGYESCIIPMGDGVALTYKEGCRFE